MFWEVLTIGEGSLLEVLLTWASISMQTILAQWCSPQISTKVQQEQKNTAEEWHRPTLNNGITWLPSGVQELLLDCFESWTFLTCRLQPLPTIWTAQREGWSHSRLLPNSTQLDPRILPEIFGSAFLKKTLKNPTHFLNTTRKQVDWHHFKIIDLFEFLDILQIWIDMQSLPLPGDYSFANWSAACLCVPQTTWQRLCTEILLTRVVSNKVVTWSSAHVKILFLLLFFNQNLWSVSQLSSPTSYV